MSTKHTPIRVKLIANPGSGQMTGNQLLERVTRILQDRGVELNAALARPNAKATPIARKAARAGYDVVIAMGGDDTIWSVMRGLAGSKTRLGVIPAGTENNVARSLGIPEDPEAACDLILSGRSRKVDLGEVKVKKKKRFLFFEVVTLGLASALYPSVKKVPKGDLSGIKDAVLTVLKQPTRPAVRLTIDGESKIKVETMLVAVSNLPIMGAHFLVAPDASVRDGLLDISVYPEFSKAELLRYFADVKEDGQERDGRVQRYRGAKIKVKASPKMAVLADGTLLGKGTVRIKVWPRAVAVIAPKPAAAPQAGLKEPVEDLPAPVAPAAATPAPAAQKDNGMAGQSAS